MIEYRTFLSYHKTEDPLVLKKSYKTWAKDAINVPRELKASYYYEHFVLGGITLIEFLKLIDD